MKDMVIQVEDFCEGKVRAKCNMCLITKKKVNIGKKLAKMFFDAVVNKENIDKIKIVYRYNKKTEVRNTHNFGLLRNAQ